MGLASEGHCRGLEGGRGIASLIRPLSSTSSLEAHTLGLSLLSGSSPAHQIPRGPGNAASSLVCLALEEPESSCSWQSLAAWWPHFLPSGPLYSHELSFHSGLSPKPFTRILFSAKTPAVATRKGSGARALKWGLETGFLTLPMEARAASLLGESPG